MKNNPDYKLTPLGYIPVDWDVRKLKNITNKIGSGITPKGGESVYSKSGRPFLRSQNIGWGILILEQVAFISEEIHSTFKSSELKLGDVLLNITGASIGRCAIVTKVVEFGNVNQHVCIIRPKQNYILPKFLNLFILSNKGQNFINVLQTSGNRQGLNYEQIGNFYIPLPPLQEQKNIAQLLLLWDNTIEKTEQLLKLKEDYKKALMQQLLTGKKRLKGFSGDWKESLLKNVCSIYDGTHQTPDYVTSGVLFLSVENLTNRNEIENKYIAEVVYLNECKKVKIEQGDILMTRIGDIGTTKYIDTNFKASFYVSLALLKIKKPELNGKYLNYFINSNYFKKELHQKTIHVAFPKKINLEDINKCLINFPTYNEQTAIVEVLEKADKEIEIIKKEIEALKEQKKGLMQILLTGKKRLK